MDIKKIKAVADIFTAADLTELEVSDSELKIVLKRNLTVGTAITHIQPTANTTLEADIKPVTAAVVSSGRYIKAPFTGVFYTKPSPDSEPFVSIGKTVKKGDTICILEAMKLMNELKAEEDSVITEICAENGGIVEYGQPLFKLG